MMIANSKTFRLGMCMYASSRLQWHCPVPTRIRQTFVLRAFPKDFLGPQNINSLVETIDTLNNEDEVCKQQQYRTKLKSMCPREFFHVIDSLDNEIIEELEYIRVMFKPSMEPDQRIPLRRYVSNIVKTKHQSDDTWSDQELEYFIWLLRYYRAM